MQNQTVQKVIYDLFICGANNTEFIFDFQKNSLEMSELAFEMSKLAVLKQNSS